MVQVYLHICIGHIEHLAIESVAIFVLQWHNGILENMLMVEMTVDRKDAAVQVQDTLGLHIAIGFILGQRKVESAALFQSHNLIFKSIQGNAKSTDKLERFLGCCLFYHYGFSVLVCHQLISHGNVHIVFIFHDLDNSLLQS